MGLRFIYLTFILLISFSSRGQFGVLDQDFDNDGIVKLDIFGLADNFRNAHELDSGKILVTGDVERNAGIDLFVCRLNSDGSYDNSFGSGGKISYDLGGSDICTKSILTSDGKAILVGYTDVQGPLKMLVARINLDGSLDSSWDFDGYRLIEFELSGYAYDIEEIEGGKILIAGNAESSQGRDMVVVSLNPDGSNDNSFGNDGIVTVDFMKDDNCYTIDVEEDGKIILGGRVRDVNNNPVLGIAILNSDGTMDNSFDTDGKKLFYLNSLNGYVRSVAIDGNGNIVAGGFNMNGVQFFCFLSRNKHDGTFDSSFHTDGVMYVEKMNEHHQINDVLIQDDGKIIALGIWSASDAEIMLARFNPDGTTVLSFSDDWIAYFDIDGKTEFAGNVSLTSDHKILIAGASVGTNNYNDGVVMRVNGNWGTGLDEEINKEGKLMVSPNPFNDHIELRLHLGIESIRNIQMADLNGRVIDLHQTYEGLVNQAGVIYLSLSDDILPGMYFLRVVTTKGTITTKLLKQ